VGKPLAEHLVVVSLDGLATADFEAVRGLPNFRRLLRSGALCRRVRGIYPTQTYALHASAVTGTRPERHGVLANTLFQPGRQRPDWFWYRRSIQVPTLYDAAAAAGLTTGSLFWPTAGRSHQRWVIPEIVTTGPGQSILFRVFAAGSPLFMLDMLRRYGTLLRGLDRYYLDNFTAAVASHLIRSRRPGLLLVHLLDLDAVRHRHGFLGPEVRRALEQQDRRLGQMLDASLQAGTHERTAFVVFGDHAYLDVHTAVHLNTALARAGLVSLDARGRVADWQAWVNTCDGSAHLYLRDRQDRALRRRVKSRLEALRGQPEHGVEEVYSAAQARRLGLGDGIDFVLEAREGFYFTPLLRPAVTEPASPRHRAAHGYRPDRPGYTSLFLATGAGIRPGAPPARLSILELGPTLAALLGLELPEAQARARTDILNLGDPND